MIAHRYDTQVDKNYRDTYKLTIEKTTPYLKNTDTVLDFACGTGITTIELAKQVQEIHAIDISRDMISFATNKTRKHSINNVRYSVCDIMSNEIKENSFDVVLAFNVLHFLTNTDEVLERIRQLVKDDGLFISVTDCSGEKKTIISTIQSFLSRSGVIPYMKEYTINELESVITKAGFSILETDNLYDIPPNYFITARKSPS